MTISTLVGTSYPNYEGATKGVVKSGVNGVIAASAAVAIMASLGAGSSAMAGPSLEIGPNQTMNLNLVYRGAFRMVEDGAPSGSDWSKDFVSEDVRLYMYGKAAEKIGYMINFNRFDGGSLEILDAQVQFDMSNAANVWVGRLIPPNDRACLASPAYPVTFDFPIVHAFPSEYACRVDGAMFWGHDSDGKLKYSVAAFDGREGGPNQKDNLMYSARLEYNFWDGVPGYFPLAWYDGSKRILALGGSVRYQGDATGTVGDSGDFLGWNIDFRFEQPFADGSAVDFEASYYDYDLDDNATVGLVQGNGYYLSAGYKFAQKVGWGYFEPRIDFTSFDRDDINAAGSQGKYERMSIGTRYLISGHNIRLEFFASRDKQEGQESFNSLTSRVHFVF